MQLEIRILRYNKESSSRSHWDVFEVEAEPDDRILDVLQEIRSHHDGSLAYRKSCAHGVCGSDAMIINGENQLACQVLVKEVSSPIKIEPIRGLPVLKDLIVDMNDFFDSYKKMLPFLISDEPDTD